MSTVSIIIKIPTELAVDLINLSKRTDKEVEFHIEQAIYWWVKECNTPLSIKK